MVRTVVSRHPLSRDALDDLVLAVDEAAAILVSHARSASAVVCVVDSGPGSLRVYLTATTHAPVDALSSSFGWFVLAALVDNATLDQKPARPPAANELSVTISVGKSLPIRRMSPADHPDRDAPDPTRSRRRSGMRSITFLHSL